MKTVWEIYNNIEKDFKKRLASSPEAVDAINELNDEELKRFRSRVFDHYLSLPENQLVLEEEINIPSKPIYGFGGAKVDTPAVYRPAKTRRVEFSEIEPFVLGQKPQGFWSRVGDDLSNVGKAWKAGNFYSEGGWNDIAQNIINGGTPEERETLYKNYLDWESKNQMPENKSWVGDVVNGVANLVPLTVDMLPEAATVGAATAAGGAALGSVVPGAGTFAGALGGLKLGFGSSMAEQSYKVGIADIYTSLRKDGVDDETAKNWAIWAGIPYGALEFMGKGVAPIQRKFLGGKVLKELIDKVSDEKIKNKILNAAAKYGADVALTGTLESAIEGGQGGITELARQGSKGKGYDVGKVASATWDEAAQAAPAMFGMAALGVPLEAATNFRAKRLQKDLENMQNAVEEGRKVIEVPAGVKLGEVFTGSDGKAYKNVDGIAQPYVVKIKPEVSDTDNLDADAESDPYGKPAEKPTDKNAQPTEAEQAIYQQELQDELARLNAEYNKIVSNANTDDSSTKTYSLAENDYAKMTDAELVEAHRKAETAKDYSAGFEIKKEWDKRRGYNRDLYHGSPSRSGASVLQLRDQLRDQGGLDKEGTVLPFQHASGRRTVHNTYEGRVSSWGDFSQEENSGSIGIKGRPHSSRPNRVVPVGGSMNEVSKSPLVQFHGRDTNNNMFNGKEALTESNISQAGNGDFKYSIDEGDYFNKARNELPIDKDSKPNLLDVSGTDAELFQRAGKTFESMPMFTRAADGVKIKLKVSEGGSMAARVVHMISNNSTGIIDVKKLAWLPNVQGTIENAQVRLKGRYATRKQGRREPNRIYIRRYGDGTVHAVVVSPYGEIVGQDIKSANVITQYPVERIGEIYNAKVDWVNPKMTEAPISKTEASHINDLSHQGTVPLPKANGSTSKGSTISDSRRLSMPEESETSRESQAKIDEIKSAVEEVLERFNRKAKVKSEVSVVGTREEAREKLGAESIPYDARGVQSGDKVVIIAENIDNADEAVRIFLHEQVGHWGLRKLLKADLKPFLNYIITHYQDSDAWKRVAKYYKDVTKNKYAIAEEVLAHVAENRELSDPSMWKRLVHRVKRELWGNGVPQEYVNLLNEDVLRSAIVLSREWAKGDHYLNANGIWAKIDSAPKGRDVPDDERQNMFSLNERPSDAEIAEAQRQIAEVKAKWTNPDGSMKKGYHCAPNGKPSKLTEEQWLLVRTPNFKKWFGDWETLAIINEVENMPASAIKLHESLDKAGIKEAFKSFGEVENRRDGRVVVFPSASAGKIRRHKGFDSGTVIKNFKTLFETAIPAISEEEVLKDGHKAHGNIDAVEHYVNKFSANGNEYFIRFTVPVIRNNKGLDNIHSSAISEVSIYKNGDSTLYPLNTAGSSSPSFIDRKLADFLNSVKPENVSKVVDENGEPMVVYHGSTAMFNEFKSKFIGHSTGTADGRGFYFTTDKNYAEGFKSKDGRVIEAFLNIRDTLDYKKKTIGKAALRKIIKEIDRAEFEADGEHYFISNFGNYYDEGIDRVINEATESNYDFCDTDVEIFNVLVTSGADFDLTAKTIKDVTGKDGEIVPKDNNTTHFIIFNPNQIKSATDNIGSFSTNNPDIRYSISEDDAARFKNELQDYIDGKLDNRHVFKLGTTPEVMRLVGAEDLPVELSAVVLNKKEVKHDLNLEDLKNLPEELADPIAIFQSEKIPNGLVVLTEIPTKSGNSIIAAIHLNSQFGKAEVNSIRSIHPRPNGQIQNWGNNGDVLYLNTKRKPSWLRVPVLQLRGQLYNQNGFNRTNIFTESDLSQAEKENIFKLRDKNGYPRYSLMEGTPENDKEYRQKRAREEIQSKAGRAVQAAVDAFAPLATLERVLYGDVRGAEKSAWKMALMTRNLDQVMFHVLRVGGIKYNKADGSFVKREGTKGLEEILKPVKGENYKNFEHYAKAKSAIERWGFLRKTNFFAGTDFYKTFGFSLEDAKKWAAEGSEASKKAFGELQIFFQGQRDFMLETGLISQEQHAALSRFKNYVPFFREGADLDAETEAAYERFSEIFPAGKGFSGRNSGVEKFEGSARRTKNLVENIVNQSRKVMDSGYKNIAAYRSLNLMRELDMAKYVRSDSVDAQVKIAEMRRALEAEGIEVGDISDEELLKKVPVEAYLKITDDSNDNIVSVRVNGTLRFYKVEDPELLVAVKNFGAEKVNVMWKLLTAPKNIMTQAITKTPEFAIRNFIRDTGSNTILFGGKTIAPYLAHTAKNAVKSAWNTADMQKVWAAGAGGGAWYSVKAEDIAADFKDGGKIQKIGKYTIKPLKWLLNEYERRILMPSEQGNRISVMQKALENGASDMEAAFQYLDVMNFGMRGSGVWTGKNEWAKGAFTALHAIIRITPFLNARIQGLYKLWRESGAQQAKFKAGEEFALKERTRAFIQSLSKAVLLRGMMLASASMLYSLYANSSTDDDGDKWFEKLPAHDKLNYWHIYLGNNNILRIPKPFEIGYIFGTIPEAITDALIQKRPQTAKVLWEGLTSQLEFDPLSNPVIDTAREQYWNKDSFTKRPIIQQSDKDLKPRYQYDPDTSATAKAVARVFEGVGLDDSWLASPARIQNVIGNFLGGMTKYITAASDVIVESLTDIEGGTSRYARENATKRVYDWAVRNTKTMSTRNAEDYYELRNRVREIYGAVRVLRQEKRLEECQNLIDEHKGELGNYNLIEAVNTRLGEISRKRKALGADRTLSTEELIRADDELLAERNRLLADVDILIDRVEKGDFNARDMRDILKRIRNADREKRDSKKARARLRELANMR